MLYIILNGKKAGYETVRSAINTLREEHDDIAVRATYEYGDIERFLNEAVRDGVKRLIVGGGDGSVNEMVDAMAKLPRDKRPELGILPLGTANDFATACQIPMESLEALRLAVSGTAVSVDIAKANDRHFMNMATISFGAQVTAETPVELKNFLGGGAYTLAGVLQSFKFVPYEGKIKTPDFETERPGVVGAVCNGRQAGGGQVLAPKAFIDDGLLDLVMILEVPFSDIPILLNELKDPSPDGHYVKHIKTSWMEGESEKIIPVNLDGEPYQNKKIRFEVVPGAIDLVLPEHCPMLSK